MKHFTTEKWIDLVNQIVAAGQKELMEKHLEQGCQRCRATVSLWQKVRQLASAEGKYQPPEERARIAKASFPSASFNGKRKGAGRRIKVLYDSFLQPVFAGARSTGASTRHVRYSVNPFQIDVQVEAKPGGNGIVVTGQLLDVRNPRIIADDMYIILSNMRGQTVCMRTNQFGEFNGEFDNSTDLQMTFAKLGCKPIVISLRKALQGVASQY